MDKFSINIFRYQYKKHVGIVSCDYLESTQDIHTIRPPPYPPVQILGRRRRRAAPHPVAIFVRERGGTSDNHVHWVAVTDIRPDEVFHGTSEANGVVKYPGWHHSVGDLIWLRSDIPLLSGRNAVPTVNLTKGRNGEIYIRDVEWLPQQRQRAPGSLLLTIAGPRYPRARPIAAEEAERYRMAIAVDREKEISTPLPTTTIPPSVGFCCCQEGGQDDDDDQSASRRRRMVDEGRARMDNGRDHNVLKMVKVEEMREQFEEVVGIVEVVVVDGGRVPGAMGEREIQARGDDDEGNVDRRDVGQQISLFLLDAFSRADPRLDFTSRLEKKPGEEGRK